jgi:hypothetical protein
MTGINAGNAEIVYSGLKLFAHIVRKDFLGTGFEIPGDIHEYGFHSRFLPAQL